LTFRIASAVALLASCGCAPAARAQTTFAVANDGVRIWYRAMGEGVPMVIIPGGPGGNSAPFLTTHSLLRGRVKVVLMDNRGRGLSDDPGTAPGTFTLDNDVKDVDTVRNALRADKIIVFGHSYGSMVAMKYAITHPERTLALITTAGVPGATAFQERNIDGVKRYLQEHEPLRWRKIVELHDAGMKSTNPELAALFDVGDSYYYRDPSAKTRVEEQFHVKRDPKSLQWNPDVYTQMIGDDPEWTVSGTLAGVELLPELGRFAGPALIMGGRFDRVCPPINQREIAEALPNARLVIFEQSGHNPHHEEPLRFLDTVLGFLDVILPPGQ